MPRLPPAGRPTHAPIELEPGGSRHILDFQSVQTSLLPEGRHYTERHAGNKKSFLGCAMPSSVGSDLSVVTALLTIVLAVLLILRHYLPLRSTPIYLAVPVFLALAIPLSIFLLVPVDLASSSRTSDRASQGIWLPNRLILVAWRLMYWLTFALTW